MQLMTKWIDFKWSSYFSPPLACHRLFPQNCRTLNDKRKTLKRVSEHFMQGTKKCDFNWSSYFSSLYASMRSPLQAFLITFSIVAVSSLSLPSNQTVDGEEGTIRTTSGDLNITQVAEPHLTEVTNSTIDSGGQSKNSTDKKAAVDTLAMMPGSLVDAGDKARLWLNQNNQMVSCAYIKIIVVPWTGKTSFWPFNFQSCLIALYRMF